MTNGLKRGLARTADIWGAIERHVAAILLIIMTLLYALNVIIRAFLPTHASSFAWIDEAARYILIWVVFLAAGLALEVGRHISVNVFVQNFPARLARILFALIDLIGLVYSLGACYLAVKITLFVAGTGQIGPTLGLPVFILYIAPIVGFASLAFRFLLRLLNIRDARRTTVRPAWLGEQQS